MNKIFYIMGKSSSGKDSIYYHLLDIFNKAEIVLNPIVLHSTRPKRKGEMEGVTYFFETEDSYKEMKKRNEILEERTYNVITEKGKEIWRYYTSKKSICLEDYNYLGIGTLESYKVLKNIYKESIIPIYIEVEPGELLFRDLRRERTQKNPNYKELCRRFLSDSDDFSEEKLKEAGIDETNTYSNNEDLNTVCNVLTEFINSMIRGGKTDESL